MTPKLLFGLLSLIPAAIAYYLYFRAMFGGKIKPHAFSWFVWGMLSGIGFLTQVSAHGGIGTWATGITSLASLTIACFALRIGGTKPTRFDWALLTLALTGIFLLFVVNNHVIALWLTLFALVAGFAMNIRKAWYKPREENATAFLLNTFKFVPAIAALASFTFLTVAYPLVAAAGNAAIWFVVFSRTKRLAAVGNVAEG